MATQSTWGHTLSCSVKRHYWESCPLFIIMIQLVLVLSLAASTLAAPKADAFYGYHHAPLLHHAVVPCKVVPKTVVIGKRCHLEPDCSTEDVVVGKQIPGHEDPVCEDVEHTVPALGYHGYHHLAHHAVKVTTKHCAPPAPIIEDITHPVTTCGVPKHVCEDVEGTVHETVCGEEEAVAEE